MKSPKKNAMRLGSVFTRRSSSLSEHKERFRSTAIQLGEKLDGTYTRYDLNRANEWLEEHGFRRAVPSRRMTPTVRG